MVCSDVSDVTLSRRQTEDVLRLRSCLLRFVPFLDNVINDWNRSLSQLEDTGESLWLETQFSEILFTITTVGRRGQTLYKKRRGGLSSQVLEMRFIENHTRNTNRSDCGVRLEGTLEYVGI